METERGPATRLGMPPGERMVIFFGVPVVGLLIGLALPFVARWALGLSVGLPMRPVFRVVGAVDRPWEIAVNLALWLVLGLLVVRSAMAESARLVITDGQLRLDKGDWSRIVPR